MKSKTLSGIKVHYAAILLLLLVLIIGLKTYKTYGTYWDEHLQQEMGQHSYDYVFEDDDELKTFRDRDYGVVTELPLYAIEYNFFNGDIAGALWARHLFCFLIYFLGLCMFYFLLLKLKFNRWIALTGLAMLVLSPRIYGHSFFNSKDIPLMVFYIICFYTLLLLIEKKNLKFTLFHAIASALLIGTRITGVVIVPFTIFFFLLFVFCESKKENKKIQWLSSIRILLCYLIFSACFVYCVWPFLWESPVDNFVFAFKNMSNFRWEGYNLVMGKYMLSTKCPWYYIPSWISLSTPVFYLFNLCCGLVLFFIGLIKLKLNIPSKKQLQHFMALSFLIAPVAAIIILNSTLYDTWRHAYFVYPFLLVSGLYTIEYLYEQTKRYEYKLGIISVTFLLLCFELIKMIQSHPYHYIYFNELAGNKTNELIKNYDCDYWGVSFKQALEKLLELDKRDTIKVTANCSPAYNNFLFLKSILKDERLQYVFDFKEADYEITNFRYDRYAHLSNAKKAFSLYYRNSEFITVYDIR